MSTGSNTNGRADIANERTRELWEIKPFKRKYQGQASKQLDKYIAALNESVGQGWKRGGESIGTNWVHFPFKSGTGEEFMVSYRNMGEGVIMYEFTKMDTWRRQSKSVPNMDGGSWIPLAAGAGLALGSVGVLGTLLAPLLLPLAPAVPGTIIYIADYLQQKAA